MQVVIDVRRAAVVALTRRRAVDHCTVRSALCRVA
jgi:hypothetical protein